MTHLSDIDTRYDWNELVQRDRVHRSIYTDPAIYAAEMTRVFGAVWVYLAHESQVREPDDYVHATLGGRPLIVTRDSAGPLRALYNRCTHRGATVSREPRGNAKSFQCPYHGWTFANDGTLAGVPWPNGYAGDLKDGRFDLAQVPRVESYRGFVFGTLNPQAPALLDWLGPARRPIDEWLDRHPGGRVALAGANRIRFKGNWKLAYDNSCDGYHVIFSHRSLVAMENRHEADPTKGMAFYRTRPDEAPMYCRYFGNGHHFKDKRGNVEKRAGGLWAIEGEHPGMEHFAAKLRARLGAEADRWLDLAASEPVNINIFPNLLILGNHIQVIEPLGVADTALTWYATTVEHGHGAPPGVIDDVNLLRLRTQESFPNFGEVDDAANFEAIQAGLAAEEDEWVWMHRGLDVPDRVHTDAAGVITAPATDEVFMREYIAFWRDLMQRRPRLAIRRGR